jgi:hypothetical protein
VEGDDEFVYIDPLYDEDEDAEDINELERELVDQAFLEALGGSVKLASGAVDKDALRLMRWGPLTDQYEGIDTTLVPGLTNASGGPRDLLVQVHDNLADLFFEFFPRSLWQKIAHKINRYERQTRGARASALIATQRRRQAQDASIIVEEVGIIRQRMRLAPAIEPWEVVRVIGLLIGNVLDTQHTGIFQHWVFAWRDFCWAVRAGNVPQPLYACPPPLSLQRQQGPPELAAHRQGVEDSPSRVSLARPVP